MAKLRHIAILLVLSLAALTVAPCVKADSVLVSGSGDVTSPDFVFDFTFSYILSSSTGLLNTPTEDLTISDISFSSTGTLGLFTLILEDPSGVQWKDAQGIELATFNECCREGAGSFIEIHLIIPPNVDGSGPNGSVSPVGTFQITEVPEPGTWILLPIGTLLALGLRRAAVAG